MDKAKVDKVKAIKENNNLLQDVAVDYVTNPYNSFSNVIDLLYSNKLNANTLVRSVFELTHLSLKTLAEEIFELTPKTLNSYRQQGKQIPMHVRELSIKLNELYLKGSRIFGTTDNFNVWMKKESYGLGGMKPIEILNTVSGIEMVMDELISIEFGTTA